MPANPGAKHTVGKQTVGTSDPSSECERRVGIYSAYRRMRFLSDGCWKLKGLIADNNGHLRCISCSQYAQSGLLDS